MTKKRKIGIAAFALPILIFLILMAVLGQYPFGNDTLMILDMDSQYHAFFVHLRDILRGDASPWYSFSRALGGDMLSVSAYYLLSPFNLLFCFFSAENIYAGIALVMLLKIGSMGWSMNYYLCRKKADYSSLLFSTAYALSAYIIAYGSNIIWLDGIIILPIMILGIEKLVDEGKYGLYLFSIAFAVLTSFYIGYMLCLFSVIYFVVYYFLLSEHKKTVRAILLYAVSSLLGGALSGVVAIPTLNAMKDGKNKYNEALLHDWSANVDVSRVAADSFVGLIEDNQLARGTPLIYCGILSVLMLLIFFLRKEFSWKKKLGYFFLLAVMFISMVPVKLIYIWHGFNVPAGAFYRYSFLYIFLVLVVANEVCGSVLEEKEQSTWNRNIVLGAGAVLLILLLLMRGIFMEKAHAGAWEINVAFVLGYCVLLLLKLDKKKKLPVLLFAVSAELSVGAFYHYCNSPIYQANAKVSEYTAYVENAGALAEETKKDEAVARTVLAGEAYRSPSDNFLFNIYGLDSYTSLEQESIQHTAMRLGYYTNMVFGIHYKEGSTHAAETLLGVKYLITDKEPEAGYVLKNTRGNLGLYENEAAIPWAVIAEQQILGFESIAGLEYNTFRYQNDVFSCLGKEGRAPIFTPAAMTIRTMENESVDENVTYVELRPEIIKEGKYYLQYITAPVTNVTAVINGTYVSFEEMGSMVKQLGYLTPNDDVMIRCMVQGNIGEALSKVLVYHEDEKVLQQYAKDINSKEIEVVSKADHQVTIQCRNAEKTRKIVLITIPNDDGWQVFVNGMEEPVYKVLGNFTGIPIEPGTHTIEMRYTPPGMDVGMRITGIAAVLTLLLGVGGKILRKRKTV